MPADRDSDELTEFEIDRIIQMSWEDRTSFDSIRSQFGLNPGEVIKLMLLQLSSGSFKLWRKRKANYGHGSIRKDCLGLTLSNSLATIHPGHQIHCVAMKS